MWHDQRRNIPPTSTPRLHHPRTLDCTLGPEARPPACRALVKVDAKPQGAPYAAAIPSNEVFMGTTVNCPEIRYQEIKLTPQDRAEARHAYVRAFEDQFSNWAGIAKACIDVDRDKDYLLLGYKTWHAWLLDAAPMSRSYIYIVVGRYKELAPDIPHEELVQMPS